MKIRELNNLISKIKYDKNSITYATNTICINFFDNKNNFRKYHLWIYPNWRIRNNDKIIQDSYNYPYHENYSENERKKEKKDFNLWCNEGKKIRNEKVKSIEFNELGDIKLIWVNNFILESFINDFEEQSIYFYDEIELFSYEIFPGVLKKIKFKKVNKKKNATACNSR